MQPTYTTTEMILHILDAGEREMAAIADIMNEEKKRYSISDLKMILAFFRFKARLIAKDRNIFQ